MTLLEERRAEFNKYVWDHAADPFQASFDERRELTKEELAFLSLVHNASLIANDEEAVTELSKIVLLNNQHFSLILQLVGLTRNKILTDLRGNATAVANKISIPSSYSDLPRSKAWILAAPYLLKRIRTVLGGFGKDDPSLAIGLESLNQSTWLGYIRQERAKRSGHEAEYRLATLLASLNIPFEPKEKAENPLCRDAQISGISFDIVIPNVTSPLIVFKSTVHTANIGQYGESKDHLEVDEARRWLDSLPELTRPLLVALIDGVGFRSNSAGLNGVLSKADEFCQFRTIWKAIIVACSKLNIEIEIFLPSEALTEYSAFIKRYNFSNLCKAKEDLTSVAGLIVAGDALVKAAN